MNAATLALRADVKVIGLVSMAHLLSHFFQLVVPPLFLDLRQEFGVTYTELGMGISAFFVASGICQTPAGFLVDRFGGRRMMLAGLGLLSGAMLLIGVAPSIYWVMAALVIGGIGNSVFHPADLALLNEKVDPRRLGHAFSVHGLGGNVGWALAPVFSIAVATAWGWRASFILAAALGFAWLVVAAMQDMAGSQAEGMRRGRGGAAGAPQPPLSALINWPLIAIFLFFILSSTGLTGFQNYAITVLDRIYSASLVLASITLTTFLVGGAAGFVAGGFIAGMTDRHGLITAVGAVGAAAMFLLMAGGFLPVWALLATAAVSGFLLGVISPSRDIIIRAVTPANARGKAYGFVYTGLDLGAVIAPSLFGWLMDRDMPASILVAVAAVTALSAFMVASAGRGPARPAPEAGKT